MDSSHDLDTPGPFQARYLAFLETIAHLRPKLHRYCARMTGSVVDGEDVLQEALFQAYRKLDTFDDDRPVAPWLFRIAHNRCIDFVRRREVRENAEAGAAKPDSVAPVDPLGPALGQAVERLVLTLPPMERACVLLKDVFDYSLEDIAEFIDSTVGGVKAALHRGRLKLATLPQRTAPPRAKSAEVARFLVADAFAGRLADSPYFGNYERASVPWRLAVGEVDGEPLIILLHRHADGWAPHSVIHAEFTHNRITRVADFSHTPWILQAATSVLVSEPS